MTKSSALAATATAIAVLLTGCAEEKRADQMLQDRLAVAQTVTRKRAEQSAKPSGLPAPLTKSDRIYLGDNEPASPHGEALPAKLDSADGFILNSGQLLSLQELSLKVRRATGITVLIDEKTVPPVNDATGLTAAQGDSTTQTINALIPDKAAAQGAAQVSGAAAVRRFVSPFHGRLSDFLDRELPGFGTDYDIRGGVIYISKEPIRSYGVVDLNTTLTLDASLSGADSGSGGSGGGGGGAAAGGGAGPTSGGGSGSSGGQNTASHTGIDSWKELEKALVVYAGKPENVIAEPTTGQVTVKCSPYCHAQIAQFIDAHNRTAGRLIGVTLTIISVSSTGGSQYGFNPTIVTNNLPAGYSFSVLSQASAVTTATGGVFTGGVINPPAGSVASKFNGSSLAIQAVQSNQNSSVLLDTFVTIANNHAWSNRNAEDFKYVSSTQNALNQSGSQATFTLATQIIGNQMQVIPRLQKDGLIRISFTLSRTQLKETDQISIGGTTATIPQVLDNSSTPVELTIPDGATIILSDAVNDSGNKSQSGAGSVFNWILGGSSATTNSKDRVVIILTAKEWHPSDAGITLTSRSSP